MTLLTLEEIMPTDTERGLVAGMPDQVAVGYIRAKRRTEQSQRGNKGLGDILGDMFGNQPR